MADKKNNTKQNKNIKAERFTATGEGLKLTFPPKKDKPKK